MNKKIEDIKKFARENNIPVLLNASAEFLQKTIEENKPKRILEIGTAIGYSGTIILLASENSYLTTIEILDSSYEIAKKNFSSFGLSGRVKQILGNAKEILTQLDGKFDFIFLDGPKGQYIYYLPYLLNLLDEKGILFADNVFYKGLVEAKDEIPKKKKTMIRNLRLFNEEISTNEMLETKFYHIGDGISVSRKR